MAQNGAVFNLWMVIVAIADVLLLLVVAALGFKIMSASALGLDEVDLRTFMPQLVITFIVANLSIFIIDAVITVSNAMVQALLLGMSNEIIWTSILGMITSASTLSIGILLLLAFLIVLTLVLLIYYLKRIVILYLGAVLSPLVVLLWLLPSFRDFSIAAAKRYLTVIFVLFVHLVILMLAVSVFAGIFKADNNPFMSALVGIATILVLIASGREIDKMAIISSGNNSLRRLGGTFVRSASHMAATAKQNPGFMRNTPDSGRIPAPMPAFAGSARIISNASPDTIAGSAAQAFKNRSQEMTIQKPTPAVNIATTPISPPSNSKGIRESINKSDKK
ncbi:MAG TPA: hypothetical protein VD907_06425 [Verrucomicrobiae bacterium]|nr:hypothetical protein [Verrucomicrobiae bacterium]